MLVEKTKIKFCKQNVLIGDPIPIYSLDAVRQKEIGFAVDRRLITISGGAILRQEVILKDFPEHHLKEVPEYYRPSSTQ